jgi:hypothetical protein
MSVHHQDSGGRRRVRAFYELASAGVTSECETAAGAHDLVVRYRIETILGDVMRPVLHVAISARLMALAIKFQGMAREALSLIV